MPRPAPERIDPPARYGDAQAYQAGDVVDHEGEPCEVAWAVRGDAAWWLVLSPVDRALPGRTVAAASCRLRARADGSLPA